MEGWNGGGGGDEGRGGTMEEGEGRHWYNS